MAEEKSDTVISFKIPPAARVLLEQRANDLNEADAGWRRPMSRHQMARSIVLAVLGAPGFEGALEALGLRREVER